MKARGAERRGDESTEEVLSGGGGEWRGRRTGEGKRGEVELSWVEQQGGGEEKGWNGERGVSWEGRRWAEDRVRQFLKHLTWRENFIWGESVGTSFTNLLLKLHSLEAFKNIQKEQPFYNNLSETGSKRKLSGLSKTVPLSSFWRKTLWNTDSSIQTSDPNKRPHFFGKRHCVFVSNALGKLRNQRFLFFFVHRL